jgi:hypothetical protein
MKNWVWRKIFFSTKRQKSGMAWLKARMWKLQGIRR